MRIGIAGRWSAGFQPAPKGHFPLCLSQFPKCEAVGEGTCPSRNGLRSVVHWDNSLKCSLQIFNRAVGEGLPVPQRIAKLSLFPPDFENQNGASHFRNAGRAGSLPYGFAILCGRQVAAPTARMNILPQRQLKWSKQ